MRDELCIFLLLLPDRPLHYPHLLLQVHEPGTYVQGANVIALLLASAPASASVAWTKTLTLAYMWTCCLKNAGEISWRIGKKTGEFCRSSICKKMSVNNAKITYHVQRDVHLHFLSPLIKKSNSSICIVYLSFLYPETKHKSYLLWETNLRLAKPRKLSSSCNLSLPLNYHYEVLFYRTLSKNFYTDYGFL